jgi:hypothetical protein
MIARVVCGGVVVLGGGAKLVCSRDAGTFLGTVIGEGFAEEWLMACGAKI